MFCPTCGSANDNEALFCSKCGSRIEIPVAPAVQTPVTPATQILPNEPQHTTPVAPAAPVTPVYTAPQAPVAQPYPSYPVGATYPQPAEEQNSHSNGLGIAAVITGSVSLAMNFVIALLGFLGAVPALVMAIIAKSKNPKSGVSTAALVISIIAVASCVVNMIFGFILGFFDGFFNSAANYM